MPPTPTEYFGLPADAWSAIIAALSFVVSVLVAIIAYKALRTWKNQVLLDHRTTTARSLLRELIELRNAISWIRSRPIVEEQLHEEFRCNPSFPGQLEKIVRDEIEMLRKQFAAFECAFVEAKLIFTYGELEPAVYLLNIRLELFRAANHLLACFGVGAIHKEEELRNDSLAEAIAILSHQEGDELSEQLETWSLELMRILEVSLKRTA